MTEPRPAHRADTNVLREFQRAVEFGRTGTPRHRADSPVDYFPEPATKSLTYHSNEGIAELERRNGEHDA